jgi:5-carboxyvanillate decarboxylase
LRIIDFEAHYYDPGYVRALTSRTEAPRMWPHDGGLAVAQEPTALDVIQVRDPAFEGQLEEVGAARLAEMDSAGVDVQVLSLNVPGCEQLEPAIGHELAVRCNDALSSLVRASAGRFVGLAALCPDPDNPALAADELARAVEELGLRGLKINSHVRDNFLDDEAFRPIFRRAEHLNAPVYLHPTIPHGRMISAYQGYGHSLAGPGLGFGAEVAVQLMRLIHSGLFDEHPDLHMVIGHLGEGLYFWLYRLDYDVIKNWNRAPRTTISMAPSEYLRRNVYVTTSGNFLDSAFRATFDEVGADHLLFASDYPYEMSQEAVEFVARQELGASDREKVFHSNAERLLGLASA